MCRILGQHRALPAYLCAAHLRRAARLAPQAQHAVRGGLAGFHHVTHIIEPLLFVAGQSAFGYRHDLLAKAAHLRIVQRQSDGPIAQRAQAQPAPSPHQGLGVVQIAQQPQLQRRRRHRRAGRDGIAG